MKYRLGSDSGDTRVHRRARNSAAQGWAFGLLLSSALGAGTIAACGGDGTGGGATQEDTGGDSEGHDVNANDSEVDGAEDDSGTSDVVEADVEPDTPVVDADEDAPDPSDVSLDVPDEEDGATADASEDTVLVEERALTFIHYNDFHANLTPHLDMIRDPDAVEGYRIEERGGAARIATIFNEIRTAHPDTITMNIGDTFHGGVEALWTDGEAIYDVVEALDFDIGVPGNWDFAYGPNITWVRYRGTDDTPNLLTLASDGVRTVTFENLTANVTVDADNTLTLPRPAARGFTDDLVDDDGLPFLPATSIREAGGMRVGFIGLTSDFVPRMQSFLGLGLSFLQGEDNYVDLVNGYARELREEGCDVVVVMSELSVHKDMELANSIEEGLVDIFFSGHTHEVMEEPMVGASGAIVVEAGNDGWVGQMDVVMADAGELTFEWTLHSVDANVVEDPEVAALVAAARAPFLGDDVAVSREEGFMPHPLAGRTLDRSIDSVIGTTDRVLHRRDALESSFNNAFTDMLRAYTGADAAISPGFRYEIPLLPTGWDVGLGVVATGEITLEEAYRYFPAPYTMGTGNSTPDHMQDVFESLLTLVFSTEVWNQEGGWVDGFSGLDVQLDLSGDDGDRVMSLATTDGDTGTTTITVAGCRRPLDDDTVLCSHSGFSNVTDLINPDTGLPFTPVEMLEWGLAQELLPSERESVVDVSETPQWPVSEFVQPLFGVE